MASRSKLLVGLISILMLTNCSDPSQQKTENRPNLTHPTPQQVAYQQKEKIAFVHFGMNTFTNREWGTGEEDPAIFNPTDFDAEQWAKTLSENGFEMLILTAKHHDGFSLWPSEYTEHDIANSPFQNGNGDIVGAVAEAARKYDMDFGVYLSPWDRHEESYGTPAYNEFYANQLRELLTNYGPIAEVWFDGAKGEDAQDMTYDFERWWSMVRELQPDALIFSDEGPDIRWIGNENGFAGRTNWSTIDRDSVTIGKPGQGPYLNSGQRNGPDWVTGECDVSIRPGWFYHPSEDDQVKSVDDLLEIYFKSVGRNCTMLLNVPPDQTGQLHENDVQRLSAFSDTLASIFENDITGIIASANASSAVENHPAEYVFDNDWKQFWMAEESDKKPRLTLQFDSTHTFNLLSIQEYIPNGQRIAAFTVQAQIDENWETIAQETTIGHKRLLRLPENTASALRITFDDVIAAPAISEIKLYNSPVQWPEN